MAKKGNYQIPFDGQGDQLHYPESWWYRDNNDQVVRGAPIFKGNEVFTDTLTFDGYSRGRSAAYFHFKRTNGRRVCVFMTDFEPMVPLMHGGQISGEFTFTKRGQNYGCQMVDAG